MMSQKVYEIITSEIIKKLEEGTVPWKVPWNNGLPVNWVTQKPYRGINLLLLEGGEYATFKQIKDAGGKVKKGAKSQLVVFWKLIEVNKDEQETEDEENENEAKEYRPLLRYYRVFNIDEQVEGLETKRQKTFDHDPIQEAEKIRENYDNAPSYTHFRKGAWYNPIDDRI